MRSFTTVLIVFMLSLLSGCSHRTGHGETPLQVVPYVDIERYMGTWYEIARYPHRFQRGCVASTATYGLRDDGDVDVLNRCRLKSLDGEISFAKGRARVVDRTTNAKLEVSFFRPFWGDYWIIDLDEQYRYAVVGHPSRKYLWVLSRSPAMDEQIYGKILDGLVRQLYDVTKLIKTPQVEAAGY
ncbi:MAG: lipocalin family protein [Chloroflexota bacterium]